MENLETKKTIPLRDNTFNDLISIATEIKDLTNRLNSLNKVQSSVINAILEPLNVDGFTLHSIDIDTKELVLVKK